MQLIRASVKQVQSTRGRRLPAADHHTRRDRRRAHTLRRRMRQACGLGLQARPAAMSGAGHRSSSRHRPKLSFKNQRFRGGVDGGAAAAEPWYRSQRPAHRPRLSISAAHSCDGGDGGDSPAGRGPQRRASTPEGGGSDSRRRSARLIAISGDWQACMVRTCSISSSRMLTRGGERGGERGPETDRGGWAATGAGKVVQ
jgi:hypothetical protein